MYVLTPPSDDDEEDDDDDVAVAVAFYNRIILNTHSPHSTDPVALFWRRAVVVDSLMTDAARRQ